MSKTSNSFTLTIRQSLLRSRLPHGDDLLPRGQLHHSRVEWSTGESAHLEAVLLAETGDHLRGGRQRSRSHSRGSGGAASNDRQLGGGVLQVAHLYCRDKDGKEW